MSFLFATPGLAVSSALLLALASNAQNEISSPAPEADNELDWPQSYETSDGFEVVIFQPQIHDWPDFRQVTARAAVEVKRKGAPDEQTSFGALTVEAETIVDRNQKLVYFSDRRIVDLTFPYAADAPAAAACRRAVESVLTPTRPLTLELDRVLANAERHSRQSNVAGLGVDPPPIFFSSEPAVFVIFLGPPKFEKISASSLFFGANTNWDILLDPATGTYYLLVEETWLSTRDVMNGPWIATTTLPDAIGKLPAEGDWQEILAAVPAKPATAPRIIVSDRPAELIVTDGPAELASIPGTRVLYLANTESDVFLIDGWHYLLTAGRWFRAREAKGPWESAMDSVPAEFAAIPADHPKAHVLASVPGTPNAEEALIAAQIPQTAVVKRSEATLEVRYEGQPKFAPIPDTTVQSAINTPSAVFLVAAKYYCCEQGVWFQATTATGPWTVCSKVPDVIYTIPASSPHHNVTYVYIYDSDDETITTGYTAGYHGSYVLGNLLVFGAGLWLAAEMLDDWDDHYHHCHWHYHPCHFSYGCGVRYNWHHGSYYRAGFRAYGPYGGAGFGAVYNPWTGRYARAGRIYGPRGGTAIVREGYNPWTNTYGARVGVTTPFGSWGRAVVVRDDQWVRAGHRSGARGSVKGIQTSEGAGAVRVDRRIGSDAFIGKTESGDVYVGRDGNLYRRESGGDWAKLDDGDWSGVEFPKEAPAQTIRGTREGTLSALSAQPRSTDVGSPSQPGKRAEGAPSQSLDVPSPPRSVSSQLTRDFNARERGTARSAQRRSLSGQSGSRTRRAR